MKYVNDLVQDYTSWLPNSVQYICTPTGSGKTQFVFEKLLPHAAKHGKYLIYFCNRRTLKKQLSNQAAVDLPTVCTPPRFSNLGIKDIAHFLKIITYQQCETFGCFPNIKLPLASKDPTQWETIREEDIMFYVFDEAHYFISDALFNNKTNLWDPKDFRRPFSVSVFLTATPEPLACYLEQSKMKYDKSMIDRTMYTLDYQNSDFIKSVYSMEFILSYAKQIARQNRIQPNQNESFPVLFHPYRKSDTTSLPYPFETGLDFIDNIIKMFDKVNTNAAMQKQDRWPYAGLYYRLFDKIYTAKPDYSYLDPYYFEEYDELIDEIVASQEKWVIFVKSEKDGIVLCQLLNHRSSHAVFISAKNKSNVKSGAKDTFAEIAECNSFGCKVLISTSVLDCGISLVDPTIKNMVIEQSEKTEFIQMLGRKRIMDGETVRLYIKAFRQADLQYMIHEIENSLLCQGSILEADGNMQKIYETESKLRKKDFLIFRHKVAKTASIHLLYALKNYRDAIDDYRQGDTKKTLRPDFYIKQQLSWIGKEYDEDRWYKIKEKRDKLTALLQQASELGMLDKKAQTDFCRECMGSILQLPTVLLSTSMKRAVDEYKRNRTSKFYCKKQLQKRKSNTQNEATANQMTENDIREDLFLPKKNRLNNFFKYMNLPYQIISVQEEDEDRTVYWYIEASGHPLSR